MTTQIHISATKHDLIRDVADHIGKQLSELSQLGGVVISLAGGSTPKPVYEQLAQQYSNRINWQQVHVIWGDERPVPSDHPDSNYRMAYDAWLQHVPIPNENIHRIHGEYEPADAAAQYEQVLQGLYPATQFPAIDLMLLGLGDDGHTASLFPYSPALNEETRWVIENPVEQLNATRITLTFPVINHAKEIIFIVSGKGKANALQQVLYGEPRSTTYPAQLVQTENGITRWFVDRDAASKLREK